MKYYSFLIGWETSPRENWILLDYKVPALDPRSAIILHYWSEFLFMHRSRKNKILKTTEFTVPARKLIKMRYRMVLEFEKKFTPEKGKTTHYYKLLQKMHPEYWINGFPIS